MPSQPSRAAKENFLGYAVAATTTEELADDVVIGLSKPGARKWLACLNPHSYVIALNDKEFDAALRDSDWLIPDGVGIVMASSFLDGLVPRRISGPAIFTAIHQRLNDTPGGKVFFLGSTEETLARIRERMQVDFPNVKVVGVYSPPFKPSYTQEENQAMAAAVNSSGANILWVGLTAPKQEKWIHENRDLLNVGFIGAVGAVFDFYAGNIKTAPSWFRKNGLEWLPRLVQEPRRLWKRTFISAPIFLMHVFKARVLGPARFRPKPIDET